MKLDKKRRRSRIFFSNVNQTKTINLPIFFCLFFNIFTKFAYLEKYRNAVPARSGFTTPLVILIKNWLRTFWHSCPHFRYSSCNIFFPHKPKSQPTTWPIFRHTIANPNSLPRTPVPERALPSRPEGRLFITGFPGRSSMTIHVEDPSWWNVASVLGASELSPASIMTFFLGHRVLRRS